MKNCKLILRLLKRKLKYLKKKLESLKKGKEIIFENPFISNMTMCAH